jgi:ABC-2 type transport system ATP-binding protein
VETLEPAGPAQGRVGLTVIRPAIDIAGLTVERSGKRILTDINCSIPAGSLTALLGPSGSGKTTLLRSIVGVQRIRSGSISVLGYPAGDSALRSVVGYVTQAPSVYLDLTVRENVRYFAALHGLRSADGDRALADVGMVSAADQLTGRLSGASAAGCHLPARCSAARTC